MHTTFRWMWPLCTGSIVPADVVISNVDAPFTNKYLLPPAYAQVCPHRILSMPHTHTPTSINNHPNT